MKALETSNELVSHSIMSHDFRFLLESEKNGSLETALP